jgi:hypothetical protein
LREVDLPDDVDDHLNFRAERTAVDSMLKFAVTIRRPSFPDSFRTEGSVHVTRAILAAKKWIPAGIIGGLSLAVKHMEAPYRL